jgi:hypothetical protein
VTERAAACLLIAALAAAGCRPTASPAGPLQADDVCVVVDDTARSRVTLGVAGAGTLLPMAGGIAAAQMFDTLVRVDCTGTVVAGLADAWSSEDRITWRLRIADGVTFSDGTVVTAPSIVESWAAMGHSRFAAVSAVGSSELHVTLRTAGDARVFALPELAVVRSAAAGAGAAAWPTGTGAYLPDSRMEGRALRLLARTVDTVTADTIEIHAFTGDPRTALDAGVDAFVSADAAALAYARALPDYRTTPLTWSRVYVLATATQPADVTPPVTDDPADFLYDIVSGDARSALPPFWWERCDRPTETPSRDRTSRQVVYERGDETARRIAERVTALAWPRHRAPSWLQDVLGRYESAPVSRALSRAELVDAALTRTDLAIVTHLPRVTYEGCASATADPQAGDLLSLFGWRVTPLIDTREHLVHRPGIGRVRVAGDGTIRFGAR